MKKNTAILDTFTKLINFNGQEFEVNLKEGDLHDSWNCITKDGVTYDFNFTWEDSELDPTPCLSIYSLIDNGDETFSTNWSDDTSIKIKEIKGCKGQYFHDKPYKFNHKLNPSYEVFNGKGESVLKTKSLNKASDKSVNIKFFEKDDNVYIIATDSLGSTLNLPTKFV